MICNGSPLPVSVAEYVEFWNRYFEMQRDLLMIMNEQLPVANIWLQLYVDMLNNLVRKQ